MWTCTALLRTYPRFELPDARENILRALATCSLHQTVRIDCEGLPSLHLWLRRWKFHRGGGRLTVAAYMEAIRHVLAEPFLNKH